MSRWGPNDEFARNKKAGYGLPVWVHKILKRLLLKVFELIIVTGLIWGGAFLITHAQTTNELYCVPPTHSSSSIYWYIQCLAPYYGADVNMAEYIAGKESSWDPGRVGDYGTSFGVYQIHLPAHRDITKEQALDPVFAVNWALMEMASGSENMWSTWRFRNAWYNK